MKFIKTIALLTAALSLSACATFGDTFDNRVACTVAGDKLLVISEYGSVGIAATINDKDRDVVCKAAK